MRLPPLRLCVLVIALAFGSAGCGSSTQIVNQWGDPDYVSPRFNRILVIGVSKQLSIRRTFEDVFVARLKAEGIDAVPSYRYIPEDGQVDEARLQEAVKRANADAAIVTRLVRVEKEAPDDAKEEITRYVETVIKALKSRNLLAPS